MVVESGSGFNDSITSTLKVSDVLDENEQEQSTTDMLGLR